MAVRPRVVFVLSAVGAARRRHASASVVMKRVAPSAGAPEPGSESVPAQPAAAKIATSANAHHRFNIDGSCQISRPPRGGRAHASSLTIGERDGRPSQKRRTRRLRPGIGDIRGRHRRSPSEPRPVRIATIRESVTSNPRGPRPLQSNTSPASPSEIRPPHAANQAPPGLQPSMTHSRFGRIITSPTAQAPASGAVRLPVDSAGGGFPDEHARLARCHARYQSPA